MASSGEDPWEAKARGMGRLGRTDKEIGQYVVGEDANPDGTKGVFMIRDGFIDP